MSTLFPFPSKNQINAQGAVTENPGSLMRHKLTHTEEEQHLCSVCGKRFAQAGHLKDHMLTHTEDKHHVQQVAAAVKPRCP